MRRIWKIMHFQSAKIKRIALFRAPAVRSKIIYLSCLEPRKVRHTITSEREPRPKRAEVTKGPKEVLWENSTKRPATQWAIEGYCHWRLPRLDIRHGLRPVGEVIRYGTVCRHHARLNINKQELADGACSWDLILFFLLASTSDEISRINVDKNRSCTREIKRNNYLRCTFLLRRQRFT